LTDDRAFGADDVAGTLYVGEGLRKLRFLMTDNSQYLRTRSAPDRQIGPPRVTPADFSESTRHSEPLSRQFMQDAGQVELIWLKIPNEIQLVGSQLRILWIAKGGLVPAYRP
jgi:hypothetical protein